MAYWAPGKVRPGSSFELYAWLFMRVSGILLAVLVLVHLLLVHIINSVEVLDYAVVAERWASPFWRTYDLLLLGLGLIHGVNGLRIVIHDYIRPKAWRLWVTTLLVVVAFVLLVLATLVTVTFQPVKV